MSKLTLTALVRAERFLAGFEDDPAQDGIAHDLATIRTAIDRAPVELRLREAARKLLDTVDFDNNGIMVGQVRTGGNGGLISLDTTRAADELRRVLDFVDHEPPLLTQPATPAGREPLRETTASQGHYDREGYCDNPARGY